jgi:hypothetical protein
MELMDRFFGRGLAEPGGPPVANARLSSPPAFAVLFPGEPALDAAALTRALRDYHPELAAATAELLPVPEPARAGYEARHTVLGLIGWGRHVVKLVSFPNPMPAGVVERCVRPAHYDPELKQQAYDHRGHVLLFYAGYDPDPLEQHVALAVVAAVLALFGGVVVLNETGGTSVPAAALLPHEEDNGDTLAALRALPLPFLYVGFVKLEVEGEPGVWMRTYGCHAFRLTDLAFRAEGHHQGTATFNLFANMLAYLRESTRTFAPGDTVNVGADLFLRLRARTPDEWFLDSPGEILVVEPIRPEEADA